MTLLVSLIGKDGLVLAADSRGTFGDPRGITAQNDTMQKAHILSPHVAILAAGSSEVGALIIDLVKKEIQKNNIDGVTPVMNKFREIVRDQYNKWFPSVPPIQSIALIQTGQVPVRPNIEFLIAGYETDNTPRLYGLTSATDFSPMLHDYGFALKGIAQYALYLLNRLYEANRTIQELTPLAIYVITETASQDGKVGGPVNVITINPNTTGCQILDQKEVLRIQKENDSRSQALRNSFYSKEAIK